MSSRDFYLRPYRLFLSYSHADGPMAVSLQQWLEQSAGLAVWFDRTRLDRGVTLAPALDAEVRRCCALLLLLSPQSGRSNYVPQEWETARARDHRAQSSPHPGSAPAREQIPWAAEVEETLGRKSPPPA